MLNLRFLEDQLDVLAAQYSYRRDPEPILKSVPQVTKCGRLSKRILREVCQWKSPRSAGRMEQNRGAYIKAITELTFSTKDEQARIESLTLLDGVGWPTASVILHFFHPDRYPILDRRALWSLSVTEPTTYEQFDRWWDYVLFCRTLTDKQGLSMRDLDKALWQYSKKNQPVGTSPS